MAIAWVGVIVNVTGIMIATAAVEPKPGKIPTKIPNTTPIIIIAKLVGSVTKFKPTIRLSNICGQ